MKPRPRSIAFQLISSTANLTGDKPVSAEHRLLMGDWEALRGPYRKEYRDARLIYTQH